MHDLKAIRFIPGTKVSHDYEGTEVKTFSYRQLIGANIDAGIGIPCKQNRLIVIDVDVVSTQHKHDGREFWWNFMRENGIGGTYTVCSPSGGFHFYFKLPESINPETFTPPGRLALGVDVKWNGWVGAPPTPGYVVQHLDPSQIAYAPPTLIHYMSELKNGMIEKTFDVTNPVAATQYLHKPYTQQQIQNIYQQLEWQQQNASLDRDEWRNGLFALKAGVEDDAILDDLACRWTYNQSYVQGDEEEARKIVARADKHGPIGPGSIFAIMSKVRLRYSSPTVETPFTVQEIFDRSKVQYSFDPKTGALRIELSETNAAALIGATYDETTLYHDIRMDLYIFRGKSASDVEIVNAILPVLQSPTQGLGVQKYRRATVAAGLEILLATRRRDPHALYLQGLRWDGTPRVEQFFVRYAGVEDSEYIRKVACNFWTGLAARGIRPGCKHDSMVVLEGDEGIFKSSLVEAIGGIYTFAPSRKDAFTDLDCLRQMHQAVVVELPELIGLVGQTPEIIKNFLAKPFDNIRALFAKKAVRNDRGFVCVGTTNSDKYLPAAAGTRRFYPVRIPKTARGVNLAGIKADRDQLFAEAVQMFYDGYDYWHMPKELLDPVVEARVVDEPLITPIKEMLPLMPERFSPIDVYRRLETTGMITKGISGSIISRIEEALKRSGCVRDGDLWTWKGYGKQTLTDEMSQRLHGMVQRACRMENLL